MNCTGWHSRARMVCVFSIVALTAVSAVAQEQRVGDNAARWPYTMQRLESLFPPAKIPPIVPAQISDFAATNSSRSENGNLTIIPARRNVRLRSVPKTAARQARGQIQQAVYSVSEAEEAEAGTPAVQKSETLEANNVAAGDENSPFPVNENETAVVPEYSVSGTAETSPPEDSAVPGAFPVSPAAPQLTADDPTDSEFSSEPSSDPPATVEPTPADDLPTTNSLAEEATEEKTAALPPSPVPVGAVVTADFVREAENQIRTDPRFSDDERRAVLTVYSRVREQISETDQIRIECNTLRKTIDQLHRQIQATEDHLKEGRDQAPLKPAADGSLAELTQQRDTYQEHLRQVQERARNIEDKIAAAQARVVQSETMHAQGLTEPLPAESLPDDASVEMRSALKTQNDARSNTFDVNRQKLSLILERDRLKFKLLKLDADMADVEVQQLSAVVSDWRSAILTKETASAVMHKQTAARQTQLTHDELRHFAELNEELANRNVEVSKLLIQVREEHEATAGLVKQYSEDFDSIRERASHGLTNTLGLLMRNRRAHLPDARKYARRMRQIDYEMEDIGNEQMMLEDQQHRFDRFRENVNRAVQQVNEHDPNINSIALQTSADQLVRVREKLLAETVARLGAYTDSLDTLGDDTHRLMTVCHDYGQFIDGKVLWIRSTKPLDLDSVRTAGVAVQRISEPREWLMLGPIFLASAQEHFVIAGVVGLFVALVFMSTLFLRNRLLLLGKRVQEDRSFRGLLATLEAVFLTILVSAPRPVLLYGCGWLLISAADSSHLAVTVGESLQVGGLLLLSLEVLRQMCRPGGLGQTHFRWDEDGLRKMHQLMPTMMLIGVPMVITVFFLTNFEGGHWKDSLGRLLFIVGMVLLLALFRRILHPRHGALQAIAGTSAVSWTTRCGWLWFAIGNLAPLALAALAGWGYFYTAEHLAGCLETTFWLVLVLVIIHAVLSRGIDTLRDTVLSSLSLQQLGRMAIGTTNRQHGFAGDSEDMEVIDNTREIRQILNIAVGIALMLGTWHIWARVLPAVNVVTHVPLWTMTKDIPISDIPTEAELPAVSAAAGDGGAVAEVPVATRRVQVPITIGDVLQVIIILTLTTLAVKNVPGILENVVLRRLPLDRGAKHAISTIVVYAMSALGVALALRTVGVDWASVQWLIAAMSVGLGFGLQEIFANVVSGLIILFERPIRIGDFITVGGETGHVTRIRFRATTVKDLDRREIVVPNKRFITDEVINWTLSDPVTRLIIPVGVAYGSDTLMTRRLLEDVAAEHPVVLDEPKPTAVMTTFGDSTLDFELRIFIPRREEFAEIQHDIVTAIDRRFQAADIEIAFPQCDLNIKSIEKVVQQVTDPMKRRAA